MKIKPYHFKEVLNKGYSLDMLYILELLQKGFNMDSLYKESERIKTLETTLRRKGLIQENKKDLTIAGKELLAFLDTRAKPLKKVMPENTKFDEWWELFPATNDFTYKGMEFTGLRNFKTKKGDCQKLFEKEINEGVYTEDQLIEALKRHLFKIKEESRRSRENKMQYLQNTHTYLYNKTYKNHMQGRITSQKIGATDI